MTREIHNNTLWTPNFILVFISNLMLFGSFYMLLPILPFYLVNNLNTTESIAGIVIALYTISALAIRPFSGFMVDKFARKPLYLICYTIFCAVFAGYAIALTLTLFILLRIIHGFAFGMSSVSGNTLAVDIMPPSRQGEGIGYFGMATSIAMALGPFLGLWLYGKFSFQIIFIWALGASIIGLISILFIKPVKKPASPTETPNRKKSINDFILLKAIPCAIPFILLAFSYGAISNYMGVYGEQTEAVRSVSGIFFIIFAAGILVARFLSGKALNRGKIVHVVYVGNIIVMVGLILFLLPMSTWLFLLIALILGLGYGFINPAFQTMFINLAATNRRGVANATFFTFWDLGIGFGIALAGTIIHRFSFSWLFMACLGLVIIGTIFFALYTGKYYNHKKLR